MDLSSDLCSSDLANFKEITMSASQILTSEPTDLPLLPLRDVVVFPHMVIPLFVGRPRSIKELELAMESGNNIMLVAQKSAGKADPTPRSEERRVGKERADREGLGGRRKNT